VIWLTSYWYIPIPALWLYAGKFWKGKWKCVHGKPKVKDEKKVVSNLVSHVAYARKFLNGSGYGFISSHRWPRMWKGRLVWPMEATCFSEEARQILVGHWVGYRKSRIEAEKPGTNAWQFLSSNSSRDTIWRAEPSRYQSQVSIIPLISQSCHRRQS
jgi:hypothetical protein